MIDEKRRGDGKDMLSFFSREKDEFGEYFSAEEVTNQAIFLMFAAHDTTTKTPSLTPSTIWRAIQT